MSQIRTEGLRKTYGSVVALEGLDLSVDAGTVFGFLGPNGAGKTTTLRLLAGLARPSSGAAWLAGQPTGPESRARAFVGYLPEEPRFYNWMTPVEFLVGFVGGLLGMEKKQAGARAEELLAKVGLADARRRRIGGFSRGMRQRLGLAQAMMNHPPVLLLDEPVSALDPGGRRDMLEWIGDLKAETTVFMSTHILEDVERICDTIGILHRGRLLALEPRQNLLSRYAVPAIEIEFEADAGRVATWAEGLRARSGITRVEVDGSRTKVFLQSPAAGPVVQTQTFEAGLPLISYRIAQPTLEDVFLRLVEA